jgi:hypothetical protein
MSNTISNIPQEEEPSESQEAINQAREAARVAERQAVMASRTTAVTEAAREAPERIARRNRSRHFYILFPNPESFDEFISALAHRYNSELDNFVLKVIVIVYLLIYGSDWFEQINNTQQLYQRVDDLLLRDIVDLNIPDFMSKIYILKSQNYSSLISSLDEEHIHAIRTVLSAFKAEAEHRRAAEGRAAEGRAAERSAAEQMPSAGCFPGDKNCTITGGRKRKTIRKRRRKTIRRRRMTKRKRRSLK